MAVRALVIQDDLARRRGLVESLGALGVPVQVAGSAEEGGRLLDETVSLLCVDVCLPGTSGAEFLARELAGGAERVVVVLSKDPHPDGAVQWLRRGAFDVLAGPVGDAQLTALLVRAVQQARLRDEIRRLRAERQRAGGLAGIVGRSPPMRRVEAQVRQAGACALNVSLVGERGVGKAFLARVIHAIGARRNGPFVPFDAGAMPPAVLEGLLFGFADLPGPATPQRRAGGLERAAAGTLFLRGVEALPPAIQARLARTLREGRLGSRGPREGAPLDVRIITASREDLCALAARRLVSADLGEVLAAFTVPVPALRQRPGDVGELAYHFLNRHRDESGRREAVQIPAETLALLARQAWPGNLRQLEDAMRHALQAIGPGSVVGPQALPPELDLSGGALPGANGHAARTGSGNGASPGGGPGNGRTPSAFHDPKTGAILPLRTIEERAFQVALDEHGGNTTRAARALGVARATFYRRLGPKRAG